VNHGAAYLLQQQLVQQQQQQQFMPSSSAFANMAGRGNATQDPSGNRFGVNVFSQLQQQRLQQLGMGAGQHDHHQVSSKSLKGVPSF